MNAIGEKESTKEFSAYLDRYIRVSGKDKSVAAREYLSREVALSYGMSNSDYDVYCALLKHEDIY